MTARDAVTLIALQPLQPWRQVPGAGRTACDGHRVFTEPASGHGRMCPGTSATDSRRKHGRSRTSAQKPRCRYRGRDNGARAPPCRSRPACHGIPAPSPRVARAIHALTARRWPGHGWRISPPGQYLVVNASIQVHACGSRRRRVDVAMPSPEQRFPDRLACAPSALQPACAHRHIHVSEKIQLPAKRPMTDVVPRLETQVAHLHTASSRSLLSLMPDHMIQRPLCHWKQPFSTSLASSWGQHRAGAVVDRGRGRLSAARRGVHPLKGARRVAASRLEPYRDRGQGCCLTVDFRPRAKTLAHCSGPACHRARCRETGGIKDCRVAA